LISNAVYDDVKLNNGQDMWQKAYWTSMSKMDVYSSTYLWSIP